MTLFLFFILLIPAGSLEAWGQTDPVYNWLNKVDLPTVSGSSLNTEDLTIAIAQDRNGNIYTLSLGSGIDKRDPEGNLLQKGLIPGGALDSPRDLVIDDEGLLYVADYLANGDLKHHGKIRVFDPSGNYLPDKTFFTSFYRPLGLDISGDKVYVAEYYDGLQGPEQGSTFSRVRIYDRNSGSLLKESRQVEIPLRIAVNSTGKVFVSQAGAGNPAVLMFDGNLSVIGQLPNITSPGSVIVDALDYIHVLEYGSRVKFSDFIKFDNLGLFEISSLAKDISAGVKNEEFVLKIFKPDGMFSGFLVNQLDFPVDLSQEGCGNLFVDNSEIFDGSFWGVYVPSKLEFDLEIYQRTPSIDAAEAPVLTCPADIEVNVNPGESTAKVTFSDPAATDNCGVTIFQTGGLASGSNFPVGDNIIEYTAGDAAGNMVTCSFSVWVKGEEVAPQFSNCLSNFEVSTDEGECGAVVTFDYPKAFDELGEVEVKQTEGLPSGSLFPVGETKQVFVGEDVQGNQTTCSYSVTVKDTLAPKVTCIQDLDYTVDYGVQGKIVEYETPLFEDNCPGTTIAQTAGLASGSEFPVGITQNTFVFTDAAGNSTTCSFTVRITENEDAEAPQIQCPSNISVSANPGECSALADYDLPEATDNSGEVTVSLVDGPAIGEVLSVGVTTVKFLATDTAGNTSNCEFTITVVDDTAPAIINCPGDQQETSGTSGFTLPDYSENISIRDCSENVKLTQIPAAGTVIQETTSVSLVAEDEFGNKSAECIFEVVLTAEEVVEITFCPLARTETLGETCNFILPDLRDEVQTNTAAEITQEPAPGIAISQETIVRFTATDSNGNIDTCELTITVEDNQVPEITCPGNKEFTFDPEAGFVVPDFRSEAEATDNCNFELVQDPAPGTRVFINRMIFLTATDASGNEIFCGFELKLSEETEVAVEITSCPEDRVLELDAACQAVLPDLRDEVQTNTAAEIAQQPAPGTLISEETTVRFTATDSNGNIDSCEVAVNLEDKQVPEISCPGNKEFTFDPETGFVVPDFRSEAQAADNCEFELVQDPAPGTRIFINRMIFLTATDASGNEINCGFELKLSKETSAVVEITSCPGDRVLELDAACQAVLPDLTREVSTNITAEVTQKPAPGTTISEETIVRFTAADAAGNTDTCELIITVQDTQMPEITCPGNKEFTFDPEAGFVVPDFRSEVQVADSCEFELVQDPEPGTRIYGSRMIFITVTDDSGNESFCGFELKLSEETEVAVEITSCPGDRVLELDAACQAVLPDLTGEVSTNITAEITQEPALGTLISEETIVRFTATDSAGNTDTCELAITIEDTQVPEITCPGNKEFTFDPEAGFVVPDFRSEAEATDNCNFELVQDPAPGTKIYTSRIIFLTAADAAGNESFCEFELSLTEEAFAVVEITSCPGDRVLELDAACQAVLPDLRDEVQTNTAAEITQEPAPGVVISQETTVRFTATDSNGNTDTCELAITVEDNQVPEITCPGDITAAWNPEVGYLLPDYTGNISVRVNCGEISIAQFPSPGTVLIGEQEIKFTVTDDSGNSFDCSFWLNLSEEEILSISCPGEQVRDLDKNCGYVLEDFTSMVAVNIKNAVVSQEPAPGTPLSDDSKIEVTATFEEEVTSCSFDLKLKDSQSPQAQCVGTFAIQLNEQGIATLSAEEIDNGSTDNCGIAAKTLSKTTFSSADVGEQWVTLTIVDAEGNESYCDSKIMVHAAEDTRLNCVEAITLQLNSNRRVILDPRELFSGGTGTVQFTVSKEEFSCADLGEQKIQFSYDSPTEEDSCEITVIVEDPEGYCEIIIDEPEDPGPFVIISPNPGFGLVEIFTSANIAVKRAEVYDMRGRFLLARVFSESSHSGNSYSLDLRKYQSGVYTIKLETNTGDFIRRAIIKND